MAGLNRAGTVVLISLALQPAMLILGFYQLFPDFFKYPYLYVVLLVAVSVAGGSMITKGTDIFATAILSAAVYMLMFRWLVASLISPNLYLGYEAYSFLSAMFLPGFFFFFVYLFVEVFSLYIGSRIRTYRS